MKRQHVLRQIRKEMAQCCSAQETQQTAEHLSLNLSGEQLRRMLRILCYCQENRFRKCHPCALTGRAVRASGGSRVRFWKGRGHRVHNDV